MCHEKDWNELLACSSCGKNDVVGSYHGWLVYADVKKKSQVTKRYKKEHIEVSANTSRRRGLELSEAATDSKKQKHQVWAVSAPFCTKRYNSDPQYLLGDEPSMGTRSLRQREVAA